MKLAIALGFAIFLPMLAYYGSGVITDRPSVSREEAVGLATPYNTRFAEQRKIRDVVNREYDRAEARFENVVFWFASGLGILAILVKILPMTAGPVGTGFTLGGIASLVTGTIAGSPPGEVARIIVLAIGLALLIALSIKKWPGARRSSGGDADGPASDSDKNLPEPQQ